MKNWIEFPRVEGETSRQAHADLPAGTYEREIGRDGFFGPAAHIYHRHPPTGWTSFEGPLAAARVRCGESGAAPTADALSRRAAAARNANCRIAHLARRRTRCRICVRNADGDVLLFIHEGAGDLFCDFGHLPYRDGDYIVLPRGTMWRLEPSRADGIAADRGDERHLQAARPRHPGPACDLRSGGARHAEARRRVPRAARRRMEGAGQAPRRGLHHHLSVQSARCGGLEGQSRAGEAQLARHPPGDEPPLSHSAIGAFDLRGRPLRRLHLRAAPDRERSRRAESAVLPYQRRLRRGDLLSRAASSSAATTSIPAW